MTKYLAFDIETAKITPEGEDTQNHRPLGICCAAFAWEYGDGEIETLALAGKDTITDEWTPQMQQFECELLVKRLLAAQKRGFTILTHNGVGFDFDILAEESGMHQACAELATNSVDTCLQVHCMKGFPIGLEAIAKGMRLQGKTEGMSGALAPQMWADGKYKEVLEYVAQDARSTLAVALEIELHRRLTWISKTGRMNHLAVPRLLTVAESLQLPEPNTQWMTDPIPRSRFTSWNTQTA